jgi:hypothetical protein
MPTGAGGGALTPTTFFTYALNTAVANRSLAVTANTINLYGIVVPTPVTFSKILVNITTIDAANNYDVGIYTYAGVLVAHAGAQTIPSSGLVTFTCSGGPFSLTPGKWWFASTGNSTTATYSDGQVGTAFVFGRQFSVQATAGGALPASMTPPADSAIANCPQFALST